MKTQLPDSLPSTLTHIPGVNVMPPIEKVRVYRVKFWGSTLTLTDLQTALDEIKALASEADPGGEEITLEIGEMPKAQFDALPEFGGW